MVNARRVRFAALTVLLISIVFGDGRPTAHSADNAAGKTPQLASPITRGPGNEKVAALTFDDGPDPRYTQRVLAVLKAERIHATFFQLGEFVEKHPELTKQVAADGHAVGNHGCSHADMSRLPLSKVSVEIDQCAERIYRVTGKKPSLFRPPYGYYTDQVFRMAQDKGYETALWTVTINPSAETTPEGKATWLLNRACPGMIILAHDGRQNRETMMKSLPIVIRGLKARGYRFVTVPELIEMTRVVKAPAEKETRTETAYIAKRPETAMDKQRTSRPGILSRLTRR